MDFTLNCICIKNLFSLSTLVILLPFPWDDSSQLCTHVGRKLQPSMLVEAYGHIHPLLVLCCSSVLLYITLPGWD